MLLLQIFIKALGDKKLFQEFNAQNHLTNHGRDLRLLIFKISNILRSINTILTKHTEEMITCLMVGNNKVRNSKIVNGMK